MKSLKQFIVESIKIYKYRLHVAGDIDKNKLDLLCHNLQKFSPTRISEPKTTPIQKTLTAFPSVANERITTIEVDCRYPVIEPIVKQLAQLLGMDENKVRLINAAYDDSVDKEVDQYVNQAKDSPLLQKTEMGSAAGAKEASKAYGDSYLKFIKDQEKEPAYEFAFDGKKTATAFDPFKVTPQDPKGANSPMSKITRPAKPQTGAKA